MGGEEDRFSLVLEEARETVKQLPPEYRIQPGGGFIENQKLGAVGQSQCQGEFGPHALGEFLHLLLQGKLEGPGQLQEQPFIPFLVEGGYGPLGVPEADVGIEGHHVIDEADLGLRLGFLGPAIEAKDLDLPGLRSHQVHDELDEGGLPRPIRAHQPHHVSSGKVERHVLQRETLEGFLNA